MKVYRIAARQQEKAHHRLHGKRTSLRVRGGMSIRRFMPGHRFYKGDYEIRIRFVGDVANAVGGGAL